MPSCRGLSGGLLNDPIRVALPLGIGDAFWSTTKFRALSAYHSGRPIHAFISESPNHQTVNFLRAVPSVSEAFLSEKAPMDVWRELPPNHRFPRWSTLAGCAKWRGFDYVLVANGHLERGLALETWLPELETEWDYPFSISPEDRAHAEALCGGARRVLLYLSGIGPNQGFHCHRWRAKDWAEVVSRLNAEGLEPLLVGADTKDDLGYLEWVLKAMGAGARFLVGVGRTTVPQYCALIESALCWAGLNSGGGILAGARRTPTVMLWSDARHPIPGVHPRNLLHHGMQWNYLAPERRNADESYRPIAFGSHELTPARVVADILGAVAADSRTLATT